MYGLSSKGPLRSTLNPLLINEPTIGNTLNMIQIVAISDSLILLGFMVTTYLQFRSIQLLKIDSKILHRNCLCLGKLILGLEVELIVQGLSLSNRIERESNLNRRRL